MEANWEVDDGYVGGARPQSTKFDISDIRDFDTWEEAEKEIWDIVQLDFDNKITYYISNLSELKKEWEQLKEGDQ